MKDEPSGKQTRKLPERADALSVPLRFEDAVRAALETRAPPQGAEETKKKRLGRKGPANKDIL